MPSVDGERFVTPAGLVVRRMRHERGWSPRDLLEAVREASYRSSGLHETLTPSKLSAVEERNEPLSYDALCLIAGGLDCDPVDILS